MPCIYAILAVSALIATPAGATSFVHVPITQSVQEAPIIVRGTTGKSQADWALGPDGAKRIYTFTELEIREVIKGPLTSGTKVNIRALGGEKNGIGMSVPGSAEFAPAEDTVLFLSERNQDGSYDVKGMAMGKYGIATDANGKEMLVGMGVEHAHGENEVPGEADRPVTLADLRVLARAAPGAATAPVNSPSSDAIKNPSNSGVQSNSFAPAPAAPAGISSPASANDVKSESGESAWLTGALGLSGLLLAAWFVFRRMKR